MNEEGKRFDFRAAVDRIIADLLKAPEGEKLAQLKRAISNLPAEFRDAAEMPALQTETLTREHASGQKLQPWQIATVGTLFIGVMIVIALLVKNPTPFQYQVFRVVLALAASGVAGALPGYLEIESKILKNSIRAGGALAVFWIVYSINPPELLGRE